MDFKDSYDGLGDYPEEYSEQHVREMIREELKHNRIHNWLAFIAGVLVTALVLVVAVPYFTGQGTRSLAPSAPGTPPAIVATGEEVAPNVERRVAEAVMPSVVGISTTEKVESFFGTGLQEGVGSGVIVSSDGYILTNAHVVANGKGEEYTVRLYDGKTTAGKLIWVDPTLDLAILKVAETGLQPVMIGDSDAVRVGDKAIAIGNPLGLELASTLTSGYISGLDRTVFVGNTTMTGLIQLDAAINKGNSGGALLNERGELVGINTIKNLAGEGLGFAIPINIARDIITKVVATGSYRAAYLGIGGVDAAYYNRASGMKLPVDQGVVVMSIEKSGPVARAGLKEGTVITEIDGVKVRGMNDLKKILIAHEVGDTVKLTVYGQNEPLPVVLGEQPRR